MWYSPHNSFLGRKYVCACHSLLTYYAHYIFCFTDKFSFALLWREISDSLLENFVRIWAAEFWKKKCFFVSHWGVSITLDDFLASYRLQPVSYISDTIFHWKIYWLLNESVDFVVTVIATTSSVIFGNVIYLNIAICMDLFICLEVLDIIVLITVKFCMIIIGKLAGIYHKQWIYWPMRWHVARRCQAITWTNGDLLSINNLELLPTHGVYKWKFNDTKYLMNLTVLNWWLFLPISQWFGYNATVCWW